MGPTSVNDNADSEIEANNGRTPSSTVDNMPLDTCVLSPRCPEPFTVNTATSTKLVPGALPTAFGNPVPADTVATAVDIDSVLATPGFLDTDLAKLLPAFDEGELPACLPSTDCCENNTYCGPVGCTSGERDGAAQQRNVDYHGYQLQAAHAL